MPLGGAPTTEDGSSCSCCVLGRSYDRATDVSLDRLTKPPRLYQSMTQKAFGASHDAAHVAFCSAFSDGETVTKELADMAELTARSSSASFEAVDSLSMKRPC